MSACLFFIAEVAAFVVIGGHIGYGWAALLLIGVSALGPLLVKRVGLGVLARTQDRLARGETPTREVLDGVVALAGGILVCVPGFVSDAIGLLLLIGPVRHILIRLSGRWMARRVETMRPVGWNAIDVRTWPSTGGTGAPTEPPPPMIEPEGRSSGTTT